MILLRILYIVNAALVALIAYFSYSTVQAILKPERKEAAEIVKPAATPATQQKPEISPERYSIIEKAQIFKNKDVVPTRVPEPVPTPTPPPLPKLELELKGMTTWGVLKAIIYNKKTKKTENYGINDVLPDTDGAKIVEITRSGIVLDRQGQQETLELYPSEQNPLMKGGEKK
ncbi:MAG: hypothetical protein NTZ78_06270 [Candidatus Aureabacteria bacterium]|nr:hypothetical protein [Candidatus Auribacterota bacterium]